MQKSFCDDETFMTTDLKGPRDIIDLETAKQKNFSDVIKKTCKKSLLEDF